MIAISGTRNGGICNFLMYSGISSRSFEGHRRYRGLSENNISSNTREVDDRPNRYSTYLL